MHILFDLSLCRDIQRTRTNLDKPLIIIMLWQITKWTILKIYIFSVYDVERDIFIWQKIQFSQSLQNLLNVNCNKPRGIIQNACNFLFSTDLNKIFHINMFAYSPQDIIIVWNLKNDPFQSVHLILKTVWFWDPFFHTEDNRGTHMYLLQKVQNAHSCSRRKHDKWRAGVVNFWTNVDVVHFSYFAELSVGLFM